MGTAEWAINVKLAPYNAVGDGVTDDTAAIQAAINAAVAAGGGKVFFPNAAYAIYDGLVVSGNNVFLEGAEATLLYRKATNDGIALDFNKTDSYLKNVGMWGLSIRKEAETWSLDKDSVGIRLNATQLGRFDNFDIINFDKGILLHGDYNKGTVYNTILPRLIFNNKINISFETESGSWCNENTIIGGELSCQSGHPDNHYAGTINVYLGHSAVNPINNNRIIGTSFESASDITKAIKCEALYNFFNNCRFEHSINIEFTQYGQDNILFYGRGLERANITDSGVRNCIYTREGIVLKGGTYDGAGVLKVSNSASVSALTAEFQAPDGTTVASIDGAGKVHAKRIEVETNGSFRFNVAGNPRDIFYSVGNPEGVIVAPPGSLCLNGAGGAGTTLYVKELGFSSTGWVAK